MTTQFEFPPLSGSYGVGVTQRYIKTQRQDPHAPSTNRELMVNIYYPAQTDKNTLSPYSQEDIADVQTTFKMFGLDEQQLAQLKRVYTHAIPDASTLKTDKPFPVIFFEHGYVGCLPSSYTAICSELSSHGYVVIATAHTYFASKVCFPDGRSIATAPEKYSVSPEQMPAEQEVWLADAHNVLEHITRYTNDPHDRFYHYFDINRMGALGHSFGGATAYLLCSHDTHFKAGIDLDGSLIGVDSPTDLKKPFMFVWAENTIRFFDRSDEELATEQPIERIRLFRKAFETTYHAQAPNIVQKTIPGLSHGGFSDRLVLNELLPEKNSKTVPAEKNYLYFMATGNVEGFATMNMICTMIVDFFNKNV
ncbi:MAG TPA: dienelactone hydrolase family protein, partial [Candidatus Babeliales bacterium]|nr:dienelactone hydrolase family protein [Candidatus Babeliales bacterium]